jgi:hypothetical protein
MVLQVQAGHQEQAELQVLRVLQEVAEHQELQVHQVQVVVQELQVKVEYLPVKHIISMKVKIQMFQAIKYWIYIHQQP